MTQKLVFTLLIGIHLLSFSVSAQRFPLTISAGINYGNYSIKDIKDFQEQIRIGNVFFYNLPELKSSEKFPVRPFYELRFLLPVKKWEFGLMAWRYSTGGRNDYEDYSGYFRTDILISVNGVGLKVNRTIKEANNYHVYASVHTGIAFNRLTYAHTLSVPGLIEDQIEDEFKSHNIIVSPGVGYRLSLLSNFFIATEARYEFNVRNSDLKATEGDYHFYSTNGTDYAKLVWDGFRIGLIVGYEF